MAQTIEAVLEPPTQTKKRVRKSSAPVETPAPIETLSAQSNAASAETETYPTPEGLWVPRPDISHLITEDDEPVDNIFSAKQQRLLVEPLYSGWQNEQPFFADANIGIFASLHGSALVPDMFLSLDVLPPQEDAWRKEHRSYFLWEYGKPPEVVVEIVSNREGGEISRKLSAYARIGVLYYVIYDPAQRIQSQPLVVYELVVGKYVARADTLLPAVELGLRLWENEFEGMPDVWLRWTNMEGVLIPTGAEMAEREHQVAEEQRQVAEEQRQVAERERQSAAEQRERAEKLAARLREMGIDPATVQ